jgi:poly-gamma-glutamate system protein
MRQRLKNPSNRLLIFLALFSILIFVLAESTREHKQAPYWNLMIRASDRVQRAQEAIKARARELGIPIDYENDPNGTGLIGEQYTVVTTDRGALRSKLLSTNPDFGAVIVKMFKECGLKRDDIIAVGMTGSFPGVNIAVYSACEEMGITPIVITSLGASNWGANHPNYSWLDMEKTLFGANIISHTSVAASLGGGSDNGRGLSVLGRTLLLENIKKNNVELIFSGNLENILESQGSLRSNVERRMEIYGKYSKGREYRAYVNVGGGVASLGSSQNGRLIPSGVNFDLQRRNFPARGVVNLMAERNIPIVHLLRLPEIVEDYGLSRDVIPRPVVGEDPIFFRDEYSISSTIIFTVVLIVAVWTAIRIDVKYYVKKQSKILFSPRRSDDPEM